MKTLIAIPCMDFVPTDFLLSLLGLQTEEDDGLRVVQSSLIYSSRNELTKYAIENDYDNVLWLDSDTVFESDVLMRMKQYMANGYDYISALIYTRKPPYKPCIYHTLMLAEDKRPIAVKFDAVEDGVFEIAGSGFGCVMTSTRMLKDVAEKYGQPFSPILGFGEDLSFCVKANQAGYHMYCDSTIDVGHLGNIVVRKENANGREA